MWILILIIYLLGVITSIWLSISYFRKDGDISLSELTFIIIMALTSWLLVASLFIMQLMELADNKIIIKATNKTDIVNIKDISNNIVYCQGFNCPLKEKCYRHIAYKKLYGKEVIFTVFRDIPYNIDSNKCNWFKKDNFIED